MKRLFFLGMILLSAVSLALGHNEGELRFVENKNQWNSNVLFRTDIPSGALFLEKNCLTYHLIDNSVFRQIHGRQRERIHSDSLRWRGHAYKVHFVQCNKDLVTEGEEAFPEFFNYYLGNNRAKWASNVSAYEKIFYRNIYDGIDLKLFTHLSHLKYEFEVLPGMNPAVIQLYYEGLDKISINKDGDLILKTRVGDIIEKSPYAYQVVNGQHQAVPCRFKLTGTTISFELPRGYDQSAKLIIDPTLIFSTYSGSFANNFGYTATFDSKGFLYSGSTAFGPGYPFTTGFYQETFKNGRADIAITKYDTTGTKTIYATYLGGDEDEMPHSLIVNASDELFIFGTTGSNNFPLGPNAYDSTYNGGSSINLTGFGLSFPSGSDIFISRLSQDGTALLSSTYIGGNANDGLVAVSNFVTSNLRYNYADEVRGEIEIDKNNNIYIATCTRSSDFPITGTPAQPVYNGGFFDAIVFRMDQNLSTLHWSTFLGGSTDDAAYSLELDTTERIYIAGGTTSANFTTTAGALFPTRPGGTVDGFITCLSNDGSTILFSTYYGSAAYDQIYFVDLDNKNDVFVFGQTEATGNTFVFNAAFSNPNSGQFISKMSPSLTTLVWSTVFGNGSGRPNISPTAFLVDLCSKVYLAGWGGSPRNNDFMFGPTRAFNGMPISADAIQPNTFDHEDLYLFVLEDDASAVHYASYFGGSGAEHVDGGTSRFDRKGKMYHAVCASCGGFDNFPTKPNPGAVSNINPSDCNCAVFKMDFDLPNVVADFAVEPVCLGDSVRFINTSLEQKDTHYEWSFGDGESDNIKNPVHLYDAPGTYTVRLVVSDNLTCNLADTITKTVYVSGFPGSLVPDATADRDTIYKGEWTTIHAIPNSGYMYAWTPAATLSNASSPNPVARPQETTTYHLSIADPLLAKCKIDTSVTIVVLEINCEEPDIYIPNAFTPNEDGKNEKIYVRSRVIKEFFFTIYDRWGEKIFETSDMNVGWDGTFRGRKCDPGVFVYYLESVCLDDQKFFKKGNITLIR